MVSLIKSQNFRLKLFGVIFCFLLVMPLAFALADVCDSATGALKDQPIKLQVPLGSIRCVPNLGTYLQRIYQLSISLVGMVAIVMIMIAGVKWITASGSGRVKEAKDEIFAALVGMFILIGAYTVLNFINPALTIVGIDVADVTLSGDMSISKDYAKIWTKKSECVESLEFRPVIVADTYCLLENPKPGYADAVCCEMRPNNDKYSCCNRPSECFSLPIPNTNKSSIEYFNNTCSTLRGGAGTPSRGPECDKAVLAGSCPILGGGACMNRLDYSCKDNQYSDDCKSSAQVFFANQKCDNIDSNTGLCVTRDRGACYENGKVSDCQRTGWLFYHNSKCSDIGMTVAGLMH